MIPPQRDVTPSEQPIDDWVGLGDLVVLGAERILVPVEGIHRAVTRRWTGWLTPRDSGLRASADAAVAGVYRGLRCGAALIGGALGAGARLTAPHRPVRRLWGPGSGGTIRAAANAIWGDELERRRSPLHIAMSLRSAQGELIGISRETLAESFPTAESRIVMLVHGWGETERIWQRSKEDATAGLEAVLTAGHHSPLHVRYNSGLQVAVSGRALSDLVESIVTSWPGAVRQIDLVGHSMGGLVARSAVGIAADRGKDWVGLVGHIVTLGTPHFGSPIEKGIAIASQALQISPESRPISDFLELRSPGVKDLKHGSLFDIEAERKIPEKVSQHFATGVVTRDPSHPLGVMLGDLVVRTGSGTGKGRHRHIAATNVRIFGGMRHPDLLADPEVHAQVRAWLD